MQIGERMGQAADPGPLERLNQWGKEGLVDRATANALEAARTRGLASVYASQVLPNYLKSHPGPPPPRAGDLDKVLPHDPEVLALMLKDPNLDVAAKEKVLEVVLLRGGSRLVDDLGPAFMGGKLNKIELENIKDIGAYKTMARDVLLNTPDPGRAELLNKLSESWQTLPDGRTPATQLMYITLQEGGGKDNYDGRNLVLDKIRELPYETQGRMYYALDNASGLYDKGVGQDARVSGASGSLGIPGGPSVGLGISTTLPPDAVWAENHEHIKNGLSEEFRAHPEG